MSFSTYNKFNFLNRQNLKEWFNKLHGHRRPRKVLDIGTGNGFSAIELALLFPNAEVWGVDMAAPYVRWDCMWQAKAEVVLEMQAKANELYYCFHDQIRQRSKTLTKLDHESKLAWLEHLQLPENAYYDWLLRVKFTRFDSFSSLRYVQVLT